MVRSYLIAVFVAALLLGGCNYIFQYDDAPAGDDQGVRRDGARPSDGPRRADRGTTKKDHGFAPDRTRPKADRGVKADRGKVADQALPPRDRGQPDSRPPDQRPTPDQRRIPDQFVQMDSRKWNCTSSAECKDPYTCTQNTCNGGKCEFPLKSGTCLIGGVCYNNGSKNPQNPCQQCTPSKATTQWSNTPYGTPCPDSDLCTSNEKCAGGTCTKVYKACNDNLSCTDDVCDTTSGQCTYPVKANTCLDNGTCYNQGDSTTDCRVCQASKQMVKSYPCVTTLAGSGSPGFSDGPAASAQFNKPAGLMTSSGKIYLADANNNRLRLIQNNVVSTYAGTGIANSADDTLTTSSFSAPYDVDFHGTRQIGMVAESGGNRLRLLSGNRVLTLSVVGYNLAQPRGVAVDDVSTGTKRVGYVSAYGSHRIYEVGCTGRGGSLTLSCAIAQVVGSGTPGHLDGALGTAQFWGPRGMDVNSQGALFIADQLNHRIRRFRGASVNTVAGNGTPSSTTSRCQSGSALQVTFNNPTDVEVDPSGTIYIADSGAQCVRKIRNGQVSTVAGTGARGYRDGYGAAAKFTDPTGLALDSSGKVLYVTDFGGHRVRQIQLVAP